MASKKIKLRAVLAVIAIGALVFCITMVSANAETRAISFSLNGKQISGQCRQFETEVVSDPESRQLGLMFRKQMPECEGMLFAFPDESVRQFWMKNTYLPLDMVFIGKSRKVVGILENVPPLNTDPRKVEHPSQYVLELNAGVARASGISLGSELLVDKELPVPE